MIQLFFKEKVLSSPYYRLLRKNLLIKYSRKQAAKVISLRIFNMNINRYREILNIML